MMHSANEPLIKAIVLLFVIFQFSYSQTTLSTAGPVGSTLTTDDYGIISSWVTGTTGGSPLTWLDYHSAFVVLNGSTPIEISAANTSLWDGIPAEPTASGFFIPNRFEDWSYDAGTSSNVWHTVVEYHAAGIDLIGGIGYRLVDPSPLLGNNYVDWHAAFNFTNTNANPLTIKAFRNLRLHSATSTTTYYSNHDDLGPAFWDNDNVDGTSDDYAISYHATVPTYFQSAFPLANYRIQSFAAAPSIYDRLTNGAADYNLPSATASVNGSQGEIGFQYQSVTLQQDQAAIFWLTHKVIKVENSASNYPTNIDWDSTNVSAADLNNNLVFANTDVSINYSAMSYVSDGSGTPATDALVYVVEITDGIIESPVSAPLNNVSTIRYWEIFYDTRRNNSTANITFTYNPANDVILDENTLELAYRTDYDQNWIRYDNIVRDAANNQITAQNVALGNTHWALASLTGDNPLPVELTSFTAKSGDNEVVLNWVTESETDNKGFTLFRHTTDEVTFEEIASYLNHPGLIGSGNDAQKNTYAYIDHSVFNGETYFYQLTSIDLDGKIHEYPVVSATPEFTNSEPGINNGAIPDRFALNPNFPNPFNPATTISFEIPALDGNSIQADLSIFNLRGQKVATIFSGPVEAGYHQIKWDGRNSSGSLLPSGIYLYTLSTEIFSSSRKLILLK